MTKHLKYTAFTLVELMVVVAIVSILSTIGYISFGKYFEASRDGKRTAQMLQTRDTLRVFGIKKRFPQPGFPIHIQSAGKIIAYQGILSEENLDSLNLPSTTLDPKDELYYSYTVATQKKEFQLLAYMEKEGGNTRVYVDGDVRYPVSFGNTLGIFSQLKSTIPMTSQTFTGVLNIQDVGQNLLLSILKDGDSVTGTGIIFSDLNYILGNVGHPWSIVGNDFVSKTLNPTENMSGVGNCVFGVSTFDTCLL